MNSRVLILTIVRAFDLNLLNSGGLDSSRNEYAHFYWNLQKRKLGIILQIVELGLGVCFGKFDHRYRNWILYLWFDGGLMQRTNHNNHMHGSQAFDHDHKSEPPYIIA